jgi:Fe-S cluster biogenesis protein NfuA
MTRFEERNAAEQSMPTDTDTDDREAGVLEAIDAIRPALQSDGGDIIFNGIDADDAVHVTLVGACGTCPISGLTMKAGIERILRDRVEGVTEVVAVGFD